MKRGLLLISLVFVCGCTLPEFNDGVGKTGQAVGTAEPVIAVLEDATGKTIPAEVSDKGEKVANSVGAIAQTGAGVATALGQPGVGALLAAIGGLAGALAGFFQRRKAKATAQAAIKAADAVPGGGEVLVKAAQKEGVADFIHAEYQKGL